MTMPHSHTMCPISPTAHSGHNTGVRIKCLDRRQVSDVDFYALESTV